MSGLRPKHHKEFPYFRRLIRAHEFAEHQEVSMIDLFGRHRSLRRAAALWKLGIDTCDKILEADAGQLAADMAGHGGLPDNVDQAQAMIEEWKAKILSIKAARNAPTNGAESADT